MKKIANKKPHHSALDTKKERVKLKKRAAADTDNEANNEVNNIVSGGFAARSTGNLFKQIRRTSGENDNGENNGENNENGPSNSRAQWAKNFGRGLELDDVAKGWMPKLCKIDRRILKFYWNFAYETILNFICDVIYTILRHTKCLLYGDMVKIGRIYKKCAVKTPIFCTIWLPKN